MAAHLRVVGADEHAISVIPLFAELIRRHDITREECITYGVVVALWRAKREVTASAIQQALGALPRRRNAVGADFRDIKRRLRNLVFADLLERTHHLRADGFSMPATYTPLGPK